MIKLKKQFIVLGYIVVLLISPVFSSSDMVEISVEVTEINNNMANELGVKWTDTIKAGEVKWTASGRIPAELPEVPSIIKVGDWARYTELSAELKFLQENGAAKILSNPKILTRSGTSAKVLVGGEIPITVSGVGGGSIQWKEFGIKTEILPKILSDNTIDLVLTTEVSRLDWANQAGGFPALMKREATSNVRLKSGQTITLAGLIETTKEEKKTGVPILCDLPLIGPLFSHKSMRDVKTDILIFVTPRIVD